MTRIGFTACLVLLATLGWHPSEKGHFGARHAPAAAHAAVGAE